MIISIGYFNNRKKELEEKKFTKLYSNIIILYLIILYFIE